MKRMESSKSSEPGELIAQENERLIRENARLTQEYDLLRTLIDSLPDRIFIKDRQSRFLINNPAHVRALGATCQDEVIGKTDLDIFPAELARQYYNDERTVMESGQPLNREEMAVNPRTNEKRWVQTTKVPLLDKQRAVVGLMGITRDITELKRTEEDLRLARQELEKRVAEGTAEISQERLLLRTLVDNLPDYVYAKDAEGRFIMANMAVARQMGFSSPNEVIGKSDFDLFPHELAARYRAEELEMMQSGQGMYNHEGPTVDKSKEEKTRWVSTTKVILRDAQGKITGFIGIGRDVTEHKQVEEALGRERSLLRTLIDNLPDAIYAKDAACRKTLANPADLKNLHCKTEAEAIGKTDFDFFPRVIAEKFLADDQQVLQGQTVTDREEYFLSDEGEKRWLLTSKLPLRDQNGQIVGLVGVGRDITEHKRAEQTVADERALLRTLVDHLPVAIYLKDLAGHKTLANPMELSYAGATSEGEVLGKMDSDLFPPEVAAAYRADDQKVLDTGQPVINREGSFTKPDGSVVWFLTSKVPLRDATGRVTGLAGINLDITGRKKAEESLVRERSLLRQSEQRLREVMRRTRCILNFGEVEAPADWRERIMNEPTVLRWNFPVVNPEAAQEVFPLKVPPGKQYQQVWSDSRQPDDFDLMHLVARDAFLHDAPFYRNEFRCTDKHGIEHWMQEFITIHKLAANRWQAFGINTDITDLKKTESALRSNEEKLREFTAQLERSNRELQDFAYVASHDLQEPLRKIVVFGERLKEKCGEKVDAEAGDYLERMQKAAARMQTLINDLLSFSRVTTKAKPFEPVDLAKVADDVVNDLEGRIEQVKGRVEVGSLPVIEAEALQMRQLLQNLIGNALKFRRPEVPPVVKVEAQIMANPSPAAGEEVTKKVCRLTVSDNGIGFDEKYLDRIFNVFQRLHSRNEYEGTGMGLAIARKIVVFHHGDITAKSKPGLGATFIVTLPVTHPKEPNKGVPNE